VNGKKMLLRERGGDREKEGGNLLEEVEDKKQTQNRRNSLVYV